MNIRCNNNNNNNNNNHYYTCINTCINTCTVYDHWWSTVKFLNTCMDTFTFNLSNGVHS